MKVLSDERAIELTEKLLENDKNIEKQLGDKYETVATKSHIHENKLVLDSIDADKIDYWNNKSDFDGNYSSLSGTPTIPSIEGLTTKDYVDNEINKLSKEIPIKVSELENDSNYISSIPEEYITEEELNAKDYADKSYVADEITKASIGGEIDLTAYLKKTEATETYVAKESGKSLVADAEIARLANVDNYDDTQVNSDITALSNRVKSVEDEVPNLATKTYVGEQVAASDHLKREIVTVLPSDTEASDNIIYMLKVESATGNDKYQEYMKIDGTVQMVGDTSVDLADYAKTVDVPTTVAQLTDSANYAKKTDLHSHTNKTLLDNLTSSGDGTRFLADDGTYKTIQISNPDVEIGDVSGANIVTNSKSAILTWTDPEDIIVDGTTVATWKGTLVVRKEDSAPSNKDDGTVIVDSKTRNEYSSVGFQDNNLEYGKTYYYRFFPYTITNLYTAGTSMSVVPERTKITVIPTQNSTLTYNGEVQTATFNNYNSDQMIINGNTGTNAGNYAATFTPNEDYCWSDGSTDSKEVIWSIGKADGSITLSETSVSLDKSTTTYNINILNSTGDVSVISNDSNIASASIADNVITISAGSNEGDTIINVSVAESANYKSTSTTISVTYSNQIKIVTFADGTDEEIIAMVEAHYNDEINLSDYWAVGDKRSVSLSAMEADGVGESHRAQIVDFAIADFDHDDLETSINGHTKAAVTLTQVDCLMDETCELGTSYGENNTENGYMNSTNTNVGGWTSSARRTWCNSTYYNSLPSIIQSSVKIVNKLTSAGNESTDITITSDKVFLLSEIEIFGSIKYSVSGEGDQYSYYQTTSNKYKLPKYNSVSISHKYWTRSPRGGSSSYFCTSYSNATQNANEANYLNGIAPCLCL